MVPTKIQPVFLKKHFLDCCKPLVNFQSCENFVLTLFAGVLIAFLEDWVFRCLYSLVLKCSDSSIEINNKFEALI